MQERGRAQVIQRLIFGLLAIAAATAHAQGPAQVDFQVIHASGMCGSNVENLAIRSQADWVRLCQTGSLAPTPAVKPASTTTPTPPPKIDFTHYILLITQTGVEPSSGYKNVFESVVAFPDGSNKEVTEVHVIEIRPGNCPRLTELSHSVSYALIPQTTNEIRFSIARADSDCSGPTPGPPFVR